MLPSATEKTSTLRRLRCVFLLRIAGLFWLLYVELQAGVAEGLLKPPDCLFLLSVFDAPAMCPGGAGDTPSCVAPPLTLIRHDGYQVHAWEDSPLGMSWC